ncbi:MAG: glutamate synthase subunit beta [Spirochaetia bacterium]
MGKPTGFMEYQRQDLKDRDPVHRIEDFCEFHENFSDADRKRQGARCMDCGVPFCHSSFGCPVVNLIPEWNDLIYRDEWKDAFYRLMRTNNFPEFTGRVCPAPCESACVLGINAPAVTIKANECAIIDKAYDEGWMKPLPPEVRTGKKVAVIGSGPSGLACADQLNQAGHEVTVYEQDDRAGGLLMYGIPNMKLDKGLVQKRLDIMTEEGITFQTSTEIGKDIQVKALEEMYDSIVLCTGSTIPRDLAVPGRELGGIHFAMDFLKANTKSLLDSGLKDGEYISAEGKKVIVIGGGDTGCDCIGTSIRHGCENVVNFELLPKPASGRTAEFPWPMYPRLYKQDYGHQEAEAKYGKDPREYCVLTKEFIGDDQSNVKAVKTVRVEWAKDEQGKWVMAEIPDTEQVFEADLVLLALGFLGPSQGPLDQAGIEKTGRGTIAAAYGRFQTNRKNIFAAGDARRGQSLVVWAINEGRAAAREVDRFLMGETLLP